MCLCLPGACGRRRAAGAPQCLHVGCLGAPHARHRHDQRLRCTPCSALQRHITSASQHGHGTRVQDWCVQPPTTAVGPATPRAASAATQSRASDGTGTPALGSPRPAVRRAARQPGWPPAGTGGGTSGLARGSQIGAGKARAEAGESLEAGLDGAESPAPEADRPSGRRAARWKECSTLRAAAGWIRRWSGGCGAGARASNGVPRTSCGSAPPKLSVGGGAPWTSTAGLRCSMALRSKVSPQGARARFAGARASRLHGSGPSSLWLRAIRLTGAQGRARAVRAPNRGSGHLAAAGARRCSMH